LATASVWKLSQDYGRLLENIVFIHLRRASPWRGIYYYITEKNKEVDFVVSEKNKVTSLIQVSYSLDSKTSREREIEALLQAMEELKVKQGFILTYSQEETIDLSKKKIIVKPVWEWALERLKDEEESKINY
jgi:hypothetical protein